MRRGDRIGPNNGDEFQPSLEKAEQRIQTFVPKIQPEIGTVRGVVRFFT